MLDINKIYLGDCLEIMKEIDNKSIDMILCDLPYGTTACKWDSIIPFDKLWEQYNRVIKDNGAIVLNASQPFTSNLIMSNTKMFKYCWVWDKHLATGHLNAKKQPLRRTEDICVFYKKQSVYNPQMVLRDKVRIRKSTGRVFPKNGESIYGSFESVDQEHTHRYPVNLLEFSNAIRTKSLHPTQKPVALFEYLIKTYTNENDTILDNCIGSGTTAIATLNVGGGRKYIGIEKDEQYYKIAIDRISGYIHIF